MKRSAMAEVAKRRDFSSRVKPQFHVSALVEKGRNVRWPCTELTLAKKLSLHARIYIDESRLQLLLMYSNAEP